ncbi:phosphoribosylaminoimidazolesuccinocarboxamide synthase [Candidatus Woesearchaeota archaeon]|nr:phosphoribosylaminoimidazolesuccinocarboxamide synthase [Candidatus Woesearchaeota archaeon]
MIEESVIRKQLDNTLESIELGVGKKYEGKVRDNFLLNGKRIIVTSDRISAFDRVLTTIPFKGQVLNQISAFWFEKTKRIVPNHVIEVPDPNVMVVNECKPYPVEMVVRGYITGVTTTSLWYNYSRGSRTFCGIKIPDGLMKDQKLEHPIITPTTKAEHGGHDMLISRGEIISGGLVEKHEYGEIEEKALKLFEFGQKEAAKNGLILVDTKYEFGNADGKILVIDEMHTPDSSRFWMQASYEELFGRGQEQRPLDKEYVRRYLADKGFLGEGDIPEIPNDVKIEAAKRYIIAYEKITGKQFAADNSDIPGRIRNNLGKYL